MPTEAYSLTLVNFGVLTGPCKHGAGVHQTLILVAKEKHPRRGLDGPGVIQMFRGQLRLPGPTPGVQHLEGKGIYRAQKANRNNQSPHGGARERARIYLLTN